MPDPSTEGQAGRYGLSIKTTDDGSTLVPWRETPSGSFLPITEPELQKASPEWFSILSLCRAQGKVDDMLGRLPEGLRAKASKMLTVMAVIRGRDCR